MGIKPTRPNFKAFSFDGTSSRNYGVYITGQGVFNAPERNVEMVEIPGRDGAYALDKGNFNNIEVTYPASIVADTSADFANAVSDLRNFLCSKVGYCRLEDEYNPNEYRMAIYKSGLEVSHEGLQTGEFDIVFECKPQRWLTSGESKQTLTSGNAITNPTLFPSRPQLQLYGYGNIDIGGQSISVANGNVGTIVVGGASAWVPSPLSVTIDDEFANTGDTITSGRLDVQLTMDIINTIDNDVYSVTPSATGNAFVGFGGALNYEVIITTFNAIAFSYGTSKTETSNVTVTYVTNNQGTFTVTFTVTLVYDGVKTFTLSLSNGVFPTGFTNMGIVARSDDFLLNSTKSRLGNPMYLDLDIGEAYRISNGTSVSVNDAVTIPAELPTLPRGATTITFDNTFTKVDIVPRWWKV